MLRQSKTYNDSINTNLTKLLLFNRNKDYKNGWTGQSNINEDLPSGTYFIVVGYENNEESPIKTFIDLRR